MKTGIIIQARMGSERFPGKVLKPLPAYGGKEFPVLEWVVQQCKSTGLQVVVATSTLQEDDKIRDFVQERWQATVPCYRGHPTDVLDRMYQCAKTYGFDEIVRITGDCPFICPEIIKDVLLLRRHRFLDYASNVDPPTWPDGLDVQAVLFSALEEAWENATDPTDRDTVLQYIVRRRNEFRVSNLPCQFGVNEHHRWVLDTPQDYERLREMSVKLVPGYFDFRSLVDISTDRTIMSSYGERNERYLGHRSKELKATRFTSSLIATGMASRFQPYGASTYSKSWVAWGHGGPLYLSHAYGSRIFDIDGNELIDMTAGLGTSLLGHNDVGVRDVICRQLDMGIAFPLAHAAERMFAEMVIRRVIYGQDMEEAHDFHSRWKLVFGKNGSDVCSAAIRLARVVTGREPVALAIGSYHGWHDWALENTNRGYGAPESGLVGRYALREINTNDFGAVIVEPDKHEIEDLRELQDKCRRSRTILIFDEMVTFGHYRSVTFARQFGFDPDLICVGKALGNGMPISSLIGRAELMDRFVSKDPHRYPYAFYSGTHFGEMCSIAAAGAVCRRLDEHGLALLVAKQNYMASKLGEVMGEYEGGVIPELKGTIVKIVGGVVPRLSWQGVPAADWEAKFRHEMARRGVLVYSMFMPTLAHSAADIDHVAEAVRESIRALREGRARDVPRDAAHEIMRS